MPVCRWYRFNHLCLSLWGRWKTQSSKNVSTSSRETLRTNLTCTTSILMLNFDLIIIKMSNFPNNSLQLEKKPRRNFKLKCSSFDLSEQSLPVRIEDLSTWQKIRTLALSLIERKSCDMKNLFHRNIDLIKQNSIDRQNWNFFVGDPNYQTNSLLCFKGENVEKTY